MFFKTMENPVNLLVVLNHRRPNNTRRTEQFISVFAQFYRASCYGLRHKYIRAGSPLQRTFAFLAG